MDTLQILVADDDNDDFFILAEAFKTLEQQVHLQQLSDGQQLLNFLNQNKGVARLPQLIILDINMPKVNGYEVLRRMKLNEQFAKIPVFVYTTCSDVDQMRKCYMLGADRFVTKGTRLTTVIAFAKSALKYLNENLPADKNNKEQQVAKH